MSSGPVAAPDKPQLTLTDTLNGAVNASETTVADQTDVAVTVYNNNRALVRDRRTVKLLPGEVSLKFMDVAQQIMPETVSLKSLSAPGQLHILEQNYEYDLMSPQKLMEKYVGRDVRLVNTDTEQNFTEVNAKLLSVNEEPVYQIGDEIYLGHPGNVVLPKIPEELIAKPTLIWLLNNDGTDHEIEATYLTNGLSWKADYVLSVNKDDSAMDLEGWVTLDNQSGTAYNNAQLQLVAGQVNVVQPQPMQKMVMADFVQARAAGAPMMQEESFAEYHLYTLQRRTTIKQNQSKQVSLLTASGVPLKKIYEYRGNVQYYSQQIPPMEKEKVGVYLTFQNKESDSLGIPLPAGIMRVYQADSEGRLQFAGEDNIDHTPKDEEVRLNIGNAFDVVAERKQTDFQQVAQNVTESEFEITLRNHKEQDITVDVVEPMPADWEVLKSSMDYEKKDAHTIIFHVPVKADGEAKVTYRVRTKY
jgi:hypothetical protein